MPLNDDDEILAAEHALGLADAGARAGSDAEFAAAVETWRERLSLWLGGDCAAPPELWGRIERALPANDDPARPWRFATVAASAVAAALLSVVVLRPGGESPAPAPQVAAAQPAYMMVASLTPKDGAGVVTVSYDARDGRMLVTPVGMDAGGKTPELWVIPADGKPRSLGVIPDKAAAMMLLAEERQAMMAGGVTLAVSLEPEGGSPTGQPTGPVVMTGTMSRV
ncbi:MAG: anti-sigma factor [Proteobacteria bacterium]|nr:anti-sigma factor [Pseudomonadota bacterium]